MQIKRTFVCPRCQTGFTHDADGTKPESCPACKYRFVASAKPFRYRMPKSLFQQFKEIATKEIAAIPPYVASGEDTDNELARTEYMANAKIKVTTEAHEELIEFMLGQPEAVILDYFRTCEFLVEFMGSLTSQELLMNIPGICSRMHHICENTLAGRKLGVRYGITPTRPATSASDK